MSTTNGDPATDTTFNTSYMSREVDTGTLGRVDLLSSLAASGADVHDVQRNINALASALGISTDQVKDYVITWASSIVGAATSSAKAKIDALVATFLAASGHDHSGVDGEGPKIDVSNLANWNDFWCLPQRTTFVAANGLTSVVTANFNTKSSGGGSSTAGVLTGAPNNKIALLNADTYTYIEDAGGQRVYGRLTEAAGVWTLTYYTNEAGVETAHNLASQDILIFYREVFSSQNRPTLEADPFDWGAPASSTPQTPIDFQEEGVSLGTGVDELDFVGAGATAARVGNKVTVTIPGGGGGSFNPTNTVSFSTPGINAFTVPVGVTRIAVVVVGGGGGGGSGSGANKAGAGGGAGGVTVVDNYQVIPGTVIKLFVGDGGVGGSGGNNGTNGENSFFGYLCGLGGRGGRTSQTSGIPTERSGGGGGGGTTTGDFWSPNLGNSVYPIGSSFGVFNGGSGAGTANTTELGGGGAGIQAPGANATAGVNAGNGGAGYSIPLAGSTYAVGGGGGGGSYGGAIPQGVGVDGGGNGGQNSVGTNGIAGTGGGGGGGGGNNNGGAGGSGRILVAYE